MYRIIVDNECGNPIDTTNVGTSIHLVVQAQSEAIQNVLYWNNYEGWDSTVAYYNIYRGVNGNGANTLYATVTPAKEGELNKYVDKVFDNTYAVGDYCYRVEAVQGPINPQFLPRLNSATSNSNEVCVTQQPKFYVPNAFAPDGINKTFIPQGQFFDYTLFEMVIYNRWGEMVYETRDINKGWDGTKDGDIVQVGSYVYMIRFVDADGKEHRRKGTVTVVK
jgi:gliding motility-associated-like protein